MVRDDPASTAATSCSSGSQRSGTPTSVADTLAAGAFDNTYQRRVDFWVLAGDTRREGATMPTTTTATATFNRETGAMWVTTLAHGRRPVGTARRATEAGAVLAALGAVRLTDWNLVAAGSPMRTAEITLPDRHDVVVATDPGKVGGYAHRAVCSCGWKSWGYITPGAAEAMVEHHRKEVI
jgi:hypothetical protein